MSTDKSLAFVFGGGGARGACQVGMLRELLQLGMVPDLLLGVSVGALNAAVFGEQPNRDGVDKLSKLWLGAPLQSLFPRRRTLRYLSDRESVHPSLPLRKLISDNLSLSDLSETRIPLHVLLADAHFGGESWFDKGPIVDILYGSAAIPGVLPPLRLGGRRYIDGGMVNPNPVQHAVKLGANRIVLLLCGSLTPSFHSKGRPLATLLMGYELTQLSLTKVELANLPESASVVVLECGAADSIDALDFRHSNLLITAGQRSAARAGERLSQLLH